MRPHDGQHCPCSLCSPGATDTANDLAAAATLPCNLHVRVRRGFLSIDEPWMRGVITDTHFYQRDRMGRLVVRTRMAKQTKFEHGGIVLISVN